VFGQGRRGGDPSRAPGDWPRAASRRSLTLRTWPPVIDRNQGRRSLTMRTWPPAIDRNQNPRSLTGG
jgi:hypothetical protein